eukprot:4184625-Prymnesium_polylepis.1
MRRLAQYTKKARARGRAARQRERRTTMPLRSHTHAAGETIRRQRQWGGRHGVCSAAPLRRTARVRRSTLTR